MSLKPCVVIVSSSSTKPKSLIKLITKETLDESATTNLTVHPYKLETKYYTADIDFIGVSEDFVRDDAFNNRVEALIIHMDSNKDNGLDDLKKWESLESDCEPDVKLLISNYCNSQTKISKAKATEWCLKRGFELVELYPTSVESQDQDIIPEKVGVERVIEALQAHVWSNLSMQGESKHDDEDILTAEGSDDFTDLFSQLHMMKDSIQSLPVRERKQCAEQLVTAFWKAIGGDEEEIADI